MRNAISRKVWRICAKCRRASDRRIQELYGTIEQNQRDYEARSASKEAYVSGDFHRQHPVNLFMLPSCCGRITADLTSPSTFLGGIAMTY